MTQSLPINYHQQIATIEGVEAVSYVSWFGGFFQNEKNQLGITAVEHNSYFSLFNEYKILTEQLVNWKNNRTGIIIGQAIANKYGWKIGDKVPLSSSIWMNREGSFSWEFTVEAIYQTEDVATDDKRIFFQHKYFDKARAYAQNSTSWFSTKISPNANSDKVIAAIDNLFANSTSATRTTTEQVFIKEQAQQFVDMAMVIKVVLIAVFFTLLLIVCNSMIQTIRERLNETAMMKALGFSSFKLIQQVYLESLLLMATGAITGCLLANLTLAQISHINSIDIKADELGLIALAKQIDKPFVTWDKYQLREMEDLLSTKSDYVYSVVGVYGVAESAALFDVQQITQQQGELILTKQKSAVATCAIARAYPS